MRIDYVLPFNTFSNETKEAINGQHPIWNIALQHIQDYYGNASSHKEKVGWLQRNGSGGKYKIRSADICKFITQKDKDILTKYNELDLRFYHISKMIEKVDVDFFSLV